MARMKTLAAAAAPSVKPMLARHGFASVDLLTSWSKIAGPLLAEICQPIKVQFPKGARRNATLHCRVVGAAALEVQHAEPQIIERCNQFFGYAAVARLKLHHGRVSARLQRANPTAKHCDKAEPPSPPQEFVDKVAGISDPELREAMLRLGTAVAGHIEKTQKQ